LPDEVLKKAPEELASSIVQVLQSIYAATKTSLLYPEDNPAVVRMINSAYEGLTSLLPIGGSLDISFVEGKLIVNHQILDDALQKRPIIGSFNELMKARRISSITFWDGITKEDLVRFFVILGTKAPELGSGRETELDKALEEQGIRHIEVNEQMYVAISKREKVVDARTPEAQEDIVTLKALKDEIFARFLAGEVSPAEVGTQTMQDIMSNPDRMLAMVEGVITEKGWDTEVEPLPFRIEETKGILERVSGLVEQVDDPLVRNKLTREVTKITSKLDTPQLAEILLRSAGLSEKTPELLKVIIPLLENPQLTAVVESVVTEYRQLSSQETADEWPSQRMIAMKSVLDEATAAAEGELATEFGQIISQAEIDAAGPEPGASITGIDLAKSLMGGGDISECDGVKGPALVWTARFLFENDQDALGAEVMDSLAEKFLRQSPEARVTAAQQIWGLLQVLRELGKAAFAADLIDEVTQILDEKKAAVQTFAELSKSLEEVSGEKPAEPDLGVVHTLGVGTPGGVSVSSKTIHKLMTADTGKVVQAVFMSGDKAAKEAITRVLLEMEDRALPALIDAAAASEDDEMLRSVAGSLQELKSDPIPLIAAGLGKELPPPQLVNLVRLVSMIGDETSVSVFNPLLVKEDVQVRSEVVMALGMLGGKQSLQMLLSESLDFDPRLRALAVRELGKFRDYLSVRRLLQAIAVRKKGEVPEEEQVIIAACRALGDLGVRQAAQPLVEIATGRRRREQLPDEVRAAAILSLGKIGGEEAKKALRDLARDRSLLIRSTARKAMGG